MCCIGAVVAAWVGTGTAAMWPGIALSATVVALLVESALVLAYWRTLPHVVRESGTRLFAKAMSRF
jgi:hypothetical protein